ncbi:hypothetical protein ACTOB_004193 [Actinoplanes oblitus]|uniref:SH3b domain-containing protein n=1 Tax=Actinoplanes oblitus TaxID=3040509 RepID=A0ABY8WUS7_9ACTN|nr:hypothetical protein [Actinoplanes oblitus]WIN00484.1 hypothetical protein ACTOB_004193 [Actinoplanes oblitus]
MRIAGLPLVIEVGTAVEAAPRQVFAVARAATAGRVVADEPPHRLVAERDAGPLGVVRHERVSEHAGDGSTRLVDRVTVGSGLGGWVLGAYLKRV